jgi:hypothetical protein
MYKRQVLRLLSFVGLTSVLAVLASSAALAQPAPTYCLDGRTTTLPTTMTLDGLSRSLTEALADNIIASSFDHSTFYLEIFAGKLFFDIPDDPSFVPGPVSSKHSIHSGACTGGEHVAVAGASFMCGAGYGVTSTPDYIAGKSATAAYLTGDPGRHYALFVQGDLNGGQLAQTPAGSPAGSFYCALPADLKVEPIMGSDGKQMLADTMGELYLSAYANGETIGHPAYQLSS